MRFLTDRQLAARNEGYNAARAGENMLKACVSARRLLIDSLDKPKPLNESAYEAWIVQVSIIQAMDYNELMNELVRVKQ